MENVLRVKIGGQAGQGVKSAGLLLARFAVKSGYNIYNYSEYPSLIRGGHNVIQVNISPDEVLGPSTGCDFLVVLNQDTIDKHFSEFTENSGVLYDLDSKYDVSKIPNNVKQYKVPFSKIATESGGNDLLINTVALGALTAIFGGSLEIISNIVSKEYGSKDPKISEMNLKALESGFNYIVANYQTDLKDLLVDRKTKDANSVMVLNGNEAVALGAIAANMQFAAIYPMSPISHIIDIFAAKQKEFGFIYKQPEDEISAINMAIGASVAGARSLTATSGGGFCLMTEGFGLAGITETPLVIIEGMRGGPATGLPTWSGQGDLQFILHAHQDEFPKIVLAPGDLNEAFYMVMDAFNLADRYQLPVVVLIDKNICEHDQSVAMFNTSNYKIDRGKFTKKKIKDYKRYALSTDGVSNRAVFGSDNFFIATSDEHDEFGFSSEEIEVRNNQMKKRMDKIETCRTQDMKGINLYGCDINNADITVISWGSNKGSILQALKEFNNVCFVQITWMNPFPYAEIKTILEKSKYLLDIECNYTGQLAQVIREKTGIDILDKMLKDDGRPFFVEEIKNKLTNIMKGTQ